MEQNESNDESNDTIEVTLDTNNNNSENNQGSSKPSSNQSTSSSGTNTTQSNSSNKPSSTIEIELIPREDDYIDHHYDPSDDNQGHIQKPPYNQTSCDLAGDGGEIELAKPSISQKK